LRDPVTGRIAVIFCFENEKNTKYWGEYKSEGNTDEEYIEVLLDSPTRDGTDSIGAFSVLVVVSSSSHAPSSSLIPPSFSTAFCEGWGDIFSSLSLVWDSGFVVSAILLSVRAVFVDEIEQMVKSVVLINFDNVKTTTILFSST
jgi:hypothetical protein